MIMGETIKQPHRDAAASRLTDDTPANLIMRQSILDGRCDQHPLVVGAAFHGHRA